MTRVHGLVHARLGLSILALAPVPVAAQAERHRVCLAPSSVTMADGNHAAGALAVREGLMVILSGPTLSTTLLEARLPGQARLEAQAAGCDVVLFTTVRHTRHQGGGGLLGRVAGEALEAAAYQAPVTGSVGASAARVAAGAAATALQDVAGNVRVKDEMRLEYRLESINGASLVSRTEKRKAKGDGEDLLSPLLEQAALAVATALERR